MSDRIGRIAFGPQASPPPPDPCLVVYERSGIFRSKPSEEQWQQQRKCPYGCGSVCIKSLVAKVTP